MGKINLIVIVSAVGVLSALLVLFGHSVYPLPLGDAIHYIPPALNVAAGRGLLNEVSDLFFLDNTGQGRFLYYPPLFQMVLGRLLWEATPQAAFTVIALLNSLTLTLCAFIFYKAATASLAPVRFPEGRGMKGVGWFPIVFLLACLIGQATRFTYHDGGRSEILATLLVAASIATVIISPLKFLWAPLGVLLGLTGAAHAVGAVLLGSFIGLFYSARVGAKKGMMYLTALYSLSMAVFAALMSLSPYGPGETMSGIRRHAAGAVVGVGDYGFLKFYFFEPRFSFYGLLLFAALGAGAHLVLRYRSRLAWPSAFFFFAVLFGGAAYYFAFRSFNRPYNIFLFSPLFFAVLIYYGIGEIRRMPAKIALLGIAGATTFGFLRCSLLYPYFLNYGMPLKEARRVFAAIRAQRDPAVYWGVSDSLWVLSEDYPKMYQWAYFKGEPQGRGKPSLRILQQNYFFHEAPPRLGDYVLKENYFEKRLPTLFGIKLANKMPGYAFAVYEMRSPGAAN